MSLQFNTSRRFQKRKRIARMDPGSVVISTRGQAMDRNPKFRYLKKYCGRRGQMPLCKDVQVPKFGFLININRKEHHINFNKL
jgi:hypothetical protein